MEWSYHGSLKGHGIKRKNFAYGISQEYKIIENTGKKVESLLKIIKGEGIK